MKILLEEGVLDDDDAALHHCQTTSLVPCVILAMKKLFPLYSTHIRPPPDVEARLEKLCKLYPYLEEPDDSGAILSS